MLVIALALGGAATVRLVGVAHDLRRAERLVDDASAAVTAGRLAEGSASLDEAERLLLQANESLRGSVELDLLGWLPGLHQNLQSLEDSVDVAATVIHGGTKVLDAAGPLQGPDGRLEVSMSAGAIPLDAVSAVQAEISVLTDQLLLVGDPPDPPLLVPQIRELRTAVHDEVVERRRQLGVLDRGLDLLAQVAGAEGPRRYLIAVANTAEMRGSGGMILNYGVLEGRDGTLDLTSFGRIDELALTEPVRDDLVPADYLARWTGFDPLLRWRQANLSGDFTVVAPVLEAMYTKATRLPVNGVIQVDPAGLAALLDGVGPVTVPELGEVRGDNVVALTLNEAYVRFPDVEQRSDVLGDVAEAAFRKLVDGEVPSLRTLGRRLAEAVDGRHIVMHATSQRTQADLAALGADGAYPTLDGPDAMALTVQNLSGTKLDYYLDSALELTGDRPAGELGSLTSTITLTNTAPADATTPRYIFGPLDAASPIAAGVARSLVTLYLPLGTSVEAVSGDATLEPVSTGVEAGRPYASFIVDVPAASARTVTLGLRLAPRPEGAYSLLLLPSPRVRPTSAVVDVDTEDGHLRGTVLLDRTWSFGPVADPAQVPAPVYR